MERDIVLNEIRTMKIRMDELYAASFAERVVEKPGEQEEGLSWSPAVDIWESEKEWVIVADLPGAGHENVRVEVIGNELVIAGRREETPVKEGFVKSIAERPSGSFFRSFVLPVIAQVDKITAEFMRGVLTVTVPKEHKFRQCIKIHAHPE